MLGPSMLSTSPQILQLLKPCINNIISSEHTNIQYKIEHRRSDIFLENEDPTLGIQHWSSNICDFDDEDHVNRPQPRAPVQVNNESDSKDVHQFKPDVNGLHRSLYAD